MSGTYTKLSLAQFVRALDAMINGGVKTMRRRKRRRVAAVDRDLVPYL